MGYISKNFIYKYVLSIVIPMGIDNSLQLYNFQSSCRETESGLGSSSQQREELQHIATGKRQASPYRVGNQRQYSAEISTYDVPEALCSPARGRYVLICSESYSIRSSSSSLEDVSRFINPELQRRIVRSFRNQNA